MILSLAAALLISQAAESSPPPAVARAAEALAACVQDRLNQAEDNVRPEVIADAIVAHCRPQQVALMASHARWVQASDLSEREKARSLRETERNMRGMRGQLVRSIRRDRRGR